VFSTDSMPRSHDAALQQRERRLNGVGVNVTDNLDMAAVFDGLVPCSWDPAALHCEGIGRKVIRHNHVHILTDVLSDILGNRSRLHVFSVELAKRASGVKYIIVCTVCRLTVQVEFVGEKCKSATE
jgi:hypothetical protein